MDKEQMLLLVHVIYNSIRYEVGILNNQLLFSIQHKDEREDKQVK